MPASGGGQPFGNEGELTLGHEAGYRNGRATGEDWHPRCFSGNRGARRHLMFTLRVWFVLISMTTLFAGGTVWSAVARPASTFPFDSSTAVTERAQNPEPRIDRYGNEIEEAVGDYRIDPGGDVYESHSPDTAVTRLSVPVI